MSKRCSSTKFAWTSWHQRQYNYILEFHRLHFYSYFHPSLFPPRPFSVVNWWSKWISRDRDQFSPPALRLIIVAVQWRQKGYWQEKQNCVYNLIPNTTSIASQNCQEISEVSDDLMICQKGGSLLQIWLRPRQIQPLKFLHISSLVRSGQWTVDS